MAGKIRLVGLNFMAARIAKFNRRLGEAGSLRIGGERIQELKAFFVVVHGAKIVRKPAPDHQNAGAYSAALRKKVDEESLSEREQLIAVSHEHIDENFLSMLKGLKEGKDISNVKIFYPAGNDIGILFPDNAGVFSVSKFVLCLRDSGRILDLFTSSRLVSYLKDHKTTLLIELNVSGKQKK